jgi:hemolysin D
MPPVTVQRRQELAFLPAALEILERPPSPIGRSIGLTIILLFALALAWATFSKIDIVASAQGKIIPSGRIKVLQPFETGVVRAIHVHDGQSVKAGDVLIELDTTTTEAERNRFQSDLTSIRLDIARLRAALAGGEDPLADFHPPKMATAGMIATQRQFLLNQVNEYHSKVAALDQQKSQRVAERTTIEAMITKLQATIAVSEQRVAVRKELWDRALGSKLIYLTDLQDLVGQQNDLIVQRSRLREAQAALAAITDTREQAYSEFHRTLLSELATAEQKAGALEQDVIKADERIRLQKLTAPVDGVVQQLNVHTIGGVVTPAQALLVIVPSDSKLEVDAMVLNRDIGFIHAGEEAEIKVDTFNFTKYGFIHGKVLSISRDAITRDKPVDSSGDKTQNVETSSSEPKGQEFVYAARVSLDRTQMQVESGRVSLVPGMAVTVEIRTGARTVLSYLFSPLLRYKEDSLRER